MLGVGITDAFLTVNSSGVDDYKLNHVVKIFGLNSDLVSN